MGILTTADIPTITYTALDNKLWAEPNKKATKSKFTRPIKPQFIPPIINMANIILFNILSPFSFLVIIPKHKQYILLCNFFLKPFEYNDNMVLYYIY